jgi:hypothetical protein
VTIENEFDRARAAQLRVMRAQARAREAQEQLVGAREAAALNLAAAQQYLAETYRDLGGDNA